MDSFIGSKQFSLEAQATMSRIKSETARTVLAYASQNSQKFDLLLWLSNTSETQYLDDPIIMDFSSYNFTK